MIPTKLRCPVFYPLLAVVGVTMLACNLPASHPTSAPIEKPSANTDQPPVVAALPDESGWVVEILSPADGATVPADSPLEVRMRFSGGEAIEARLLIDSTQVGNLVTSLQPGQEILLGWPTPTEGKHELQVEVLDSEKQTHSNHLAIFVANAGSVSGLTALPMITPPASGAIITFPNATNGTQLSAWVDSHGLPYVSVSVEANGSSIKDIVLDADGLQVARSHNDSYADPFRTDLVWSPYRGNGTYTVSAYARTAEEHENHFQPVANATLTVNVVGIPPEVKSIRQRFIDLYPQRFGQSVPIPAFARYIKPSPAAIDSSRWVSVAYLGEYEYEINIMDDGSVTTRKMAVNHQENGVSDSICRPMGNWKVLVVFVDYSNTGISQAQTVNALQEAEAKANRWHQDFASAHGLAAPLVHVQTTPAYLASPPHSGELASAAEILAATGFRTSDYAITMEVDLDSNATFSKKYGGLGFTLYGGCRPDGSQRINFYMTVQSQSDMLGDLALSLFDHEFSHGMGWMHWWPTGDGSAGQELVWNYDNSCLATLFFGWLDVDGDGVIEILDPTPYGRS